MFRFIRVSPAPASRFCQRSHIAGRKLMAWTLVLAIALVGTSGCAANQSEQGSDPAQTSQAEQSAEQTTQDDGGSSAEPADDSPGAASEASDSATEALVPDVTGQQESDAVATLQAAGFTTQVAWQESSELYRTVLSTDPEAGATVPPNQPITVYVASPGARSELYLADYLLCSRTSIEQYLTWKGWTKQLDGGTWMEWSKAGVGTLEFGHNLPQIDDVPNEPPADSFNFVGYRPESLTSNLAGATTSLDYLHKAEQVCGFGDPIARYDVGEEPSSYSDGSPSVSELGTASDSAYWFVTAESSRYDGSMRVVLQVAGKDLMGSDPQTALFNFYMNMHVG